LSLIKTQLSLARSRPRDADTLLEMMAGMEGDVDRMTRLLEQMLALARVEQRGLETFAPVDLGSLLQDVTGQFQIRAFQQGIALGLNLPPKVDLTIQGDQARLRQVLSNLIENALKYTPRGGLVSLEVTRNCDQTEIAVADSGEAIPPEHLPHIFERFYRVESSRSRDSGGAGLGLAISQEIVHRHGGTIEVQSESGSSTTFTVRLPA
jgi:signal transduction histidine kinase